MDIQKIKKFIELQERVNREIDNYGEASQLSCDMLEELGDSLTYEEIQKVTSLYRSTL